MLGAANKPVHVLLSPQTCYNIDAVECIRVGAATDTRAHNDTAIDSPLFPLRVLLVVVANT